MKILLSSNKEIIKEYIKANSKIGFIPTASELDNDRWYMEIVQGYYMSKLMI